jgi:hypothetical protein
VPTPSNPGRFAGNERLRLDITEVVLTYVGDDGTALVMETWHPDHGWRSRLRE